MKSVCKYPPVQYHDEVREMKKDLRSGMVCAMAVRSRKRRFFIYVLITTSLVLFFVWQNLGGTLTNHQGLIDLETNLVGYKTMIGREGSLKNTSVTPASVQAIRSAVITNAITNATKVPTNVANVTSKPYHQSGQCDDECEWQNMQRNRKDRVHDACEASFSRAVDFGSVDWSDTKFRKHFDHILVSDQFQLLYCYVPKVGCTNWKRIFLTLNGEVAASEAIPQKKVHYMPIPKLSDFAFEEAEERLEKYTKFVFVRNPHERLLSAYKDKLETKNDRNLGIRKQYGRKIYKYNTQNDKNKYSKYAKNYQDEQTPKRNDNGQFDVTFQEFMRYVSDTRNRLNEPAEEHWREIDRLCSPCTISYDIIGKMETLDNDTHFILKHSGANELVEKLGRSTNPTNSSKEAIVQNAYAQLTANDMNLFERRFQKDLDLFDYQRPKSITRLKSDEEDRKERVEKLRTVTAIKPGNVNIKTPRRPDPQRPGRPIVKDYFPEANNYNYYQDQLQDRTRARPGTNRGDEHLARVRRIEDEVDMHKRLMLQRIQENLRPGLKDSSSVGPPHARPRRVFDRRLYGDDLYGFGRDRFADDTAFDMRRRYRRRY